MWQFFFNFEKNLVFSMFKHVNQFLMYQPIFNALINP
jgi:hypothetical protein